jgi:hypothetical protein
MTRLTDRLTADGVAFVARHAWRRVWQPIDRILAAHKTRSFCLNSTVPICIPCATTDDVAFVEEQLAAVQALSEADRRVQAVVPYCRGLRPQLPAGKKNHVQLYEVDDELMLLSYVSDHGYIIISDASESTATKHIRTLLQRLGLSPFPNVDVFKRYFAEHDPPRISGKVGITYPTYSLLAMRLGGGQYGFTEPIAWDIVQELPWKFEHLRQRSRVRTIPISVLASGHGRAGRQVAVGKLYGERYFRGESLLDIGCDLCGVKRFVGPETKYVGVDIQGLADYCVDLDQEPLPFEDRSFETVLCFETLEHLRDIHGQLDRMMAVARRFIVGSLFIESAYAKGRSVNFFGDPLGNAHLPIAPVYDRHQWIFSFSDALDFLYYRARRSGFRIAELTLFYDNLIFDRRRQVQRAFRRGDYKTLGKLVTILGFALEREE